MLQFVLVAGLGGFHDQLELVDDAFVVVDHGEEGFVLFD